MRELLSYNSLFVGQLYKDRSLALHARDLIFLTNDLEKRKLLLNNTLLELIYFLTFKHFLLRKNNKRMLSVAVMIGTLTLSC